jgi:beta-lactamase regulating signal transducer with metallopeptidase domain
LLVRALPVAVAIPLVAGVVVPAFHLFEPRQGEEAVGTSLVALAVVGASFLAAGLVRGWRALRTTRRLVRQWLLDAQPVEVGDARMRVLRIESPFPVVAVVGLVRPQLLVSRRVLDACTPQQLRAVVAHESAHVRAWDNLKRLAIRACPDLLALGPPGREMERDWHRAAEEAADDRAATTAGPAALDLAEALLAVARLATPPPAKALLVSSLFEGESIERRVRRLLDRRSPRRRFPLWFVAARAIGLAASVAVLACVIDIRLLAGVQELLELVVSTLP